MHFKLIIALVEDDKTDDVMKAARQAGATGATVINHARGEGLKQSKTFAAGMVDHGGTGQPCPRRRLETEQNLFGFVARNPA